jgi:hypothetical protein
MQTNLYIPKKIKVGFQKRSDTFTGKLAFITYEDDKGVLRQEKSWNGWRDHKIQIQEFDNTPQSNFVINKDIHRSGHWSSHSKVRIYDSRDFEFEIELSNMIYILMHSDVSKRDIQENCVFAWDGKSLVLVPVNSEEYQKSLEHTRKQNVEFSLKNLVQGHTYSTKKAGDYIYLGYFDWCEKTYSSFNHSQYWKSVGKKHIFYSETKNYYGHFHTLNSKDLCECISSEIHPKYSNFVESMLKSPHCQKIGKFNVKKGFDKVGYKRTAYEDMEVTLFDGPKPSFDVELVDLRSEQDKPKIVRQKDNKQDYYRSYYNKKHEFERMMQKERINTKDIDAIKKFFEDYGFGTLYFTNSEGKKEVVSNK